MKMNPTTLVLLLIVSAHAEIPSMHGNNEMHRYRKAKPAPLNDDVPYLMCPVCEKMAAEAEAVAEAKNAVPCRNPLRTCASKMRTSRAAMWRIQLRLCSAINCETDGWELGAFSIRRPISCNNHVYNFHVSELLNLIFG